MSVQSYVLLKCYSSEISRAYTFAKGNQGLCMDGRQSCLDKQVIKLYFKCDVNLTTTTTTTVFTACNHIRNLAAGLLQSNPNPSVDSERQRGRKPVLWSD